MLRARSLLTVVFVLLLVTAGWTYYRAAVEPRPMADAAAAFLKALDVDQQKIALMPYDAPQRVDWHFIPKSERKGLQVKDMTAPQQAAAHTLLRSALSAAGYDKATRIMELEQLLAALEAGRGRSIRDPQRYYFTLFGRPSTETKWGLSVEGHHLSLNFVVEHGRIVSSTPQVFCTNPATVKSGNDVGIPVGTRILKDEEALAFDLLHALSDQQRKAAIFAPTALPEVREPASPQPPQDPPVGLPAGDMPAEQQAQLRTLIEVYAAAMSEDVAAARMSAIDEAGFEGVHFGWAGATEPGSGHYYRIQGPTFVVEFVNTQPDAAGNPANHIHTVWRDMHGDFGVPLR